VLRSPLHFTISLLHWAEPSSRILVESIHHERVGLVLHRSEYRDLCGLHVEHNAQPQRIW